MNAPSPFVLLAHGLLALFVCWGWSYAWRRANGGERLQPDVVESETYAGRSIAGNAAVIEKLAALVRRARAARG